jgi:hypothetical protein
MQNIPFFHIALTDVSKNYLDKSLQIIPHANADPFSGKGLKSIIDAIDEEYFIIYLKPDLPKPGEFSFERMFQVSRDTGAGILYADYMEKKGEMKCPHPLNDYQSGSIRDDFDFGPLLFINSKAAKDSAKNISEKVKSAALYDLRLTISRSYPIVHLSEFLYTTEETISTDTEKKQFAYVDPKNRAVQIEMEEVCTKHLKSLRAWLPPVFEDIDLKKGIFPVEASVIIPVRNRARTICDAIDSVLNQKTGFSYNLIVIDNHSTDGTTEMIAGKKSNDSRIIHLIPERDDLGIGGCWNEGIHNENCGRFAIQLDSDDVYSDENTLDHIVKEFYTQNCAMLVGSYRMCNFDLQTIPPGVIDHREWTPENGRNNALRINGLGAPRAFYTPILREIKVPNTSYGEDYALGLQISRRWKIGRIYDVLYLCRRWEDNSDASIDIIKANNYNAYKDKLRSIELSARQKIKTEMP